MSLLIRECVQQLIAANDAIRRKAENRCSKTEIATAEILSYFRSHPEGHKARPKDVESSVDRDTKCYAFRQLAERGVLQYEGYDSRVRLYWLPGV